MRRSESSSYGADDARSIYSEKAQEYPSVECEQSDERAAEFVRFETQHIFRNDHTDRAQYALPEGIPKHHAGVRRIELFINIEPVSDSDPA
jgi:hypothetical protein